MIFDVKTGIDSIKFGLNKPAASATQDELITALNCCADIFDITGAEYGMIAACVVSRLADKEIHVEWNGKTKSFTRKRGG